MRLRTRDVRIKRAQLLVASAYPGLREKMSKRDARLLGDTQCVGPQGVALGSIAQGNALELRS